MVRAKSFKNMVQRNPGIDGLCNIMFSREDKVLGNFSFGTEFVESGHSTRSGSALTRK
jgi:hypothetical protein